MAKNIMRRFRITELSAVDRPAQSPALAAIIKRENANMPEDIRKVVSEVSEDVVKRWLDPQDGARPFTTFLQSSIDADMYWAATRNADSELSALNQSLCSIIGDAGLSVADKEAMARNAVEEFLAALRSKWPEIEEALMKVFSEEPVKKGAGNMDREKITADDLQQKIDELTKRLEKAEAGADDALKAQVAELTKERDTLKAEADARKAHDEAIAKLSREEKAFMDEMEDEEKRKAFVAMSKEDRQKLMDKAKKTKKAAEDDDEVVKVDDTEIRKSVVGDAQFAIFKAMAAKQQALIEKAEAQAEEIAKRDFEKRAEAELPNLPGTVEERGAVLKAIAGMPEEVRKSAEKMLKAGDAAMVAAFDSIGHMSGEVSKSGADFNKRVSEIKARDNCTPTEALRKARKEYPEEYAAYQEAGKTAAEKIGKRIAN